MSTNRKRRAPHGTPREMADDQHPTDEARGIDEAERAAKAKQWITRGRATADTPLFPALPPEPRHRDDG